MVPISPNSHQHLLLSLSLSHLPLSLFVILAILGGILLWFGFEFN